MRAAASLRPDVSTVPRRIRWHPSLRLNSWLSFPLYYSRRPTSWTPSGSCPLCLTPPCYHFEPPATAALFCRRRLGPFRPRFVREISVRSRLNRQLPSRFGPVRRLGNHILTFLSRVLDRPDPPGSYGSG